MAPTAAYIVNLAGCTALAYICARLSSFISLHFLHRSKISRYQHGASPGNQQKAWALVTGASDGIGKGFAEELCSRGFNVVLHGRNQKKLEGVKVELNKGWPTVETRIAPLDVSRADGNAVDQFVAGLKDLNITILINNVGGAEMISPTWRTVESLNHENIDALINNNDIFMTKLTAKMLQVFRSRQPSLIMNVGSITADAPSAYLTIYGATKAYVQSFSRSLAAELRGEKVDIEVISLTVGETQAQWDRSPTNFLRCSARRLAKDSLRIVGCGHSVVTPYIGHALLEKLLQFTPRLIIEGIVIDMAKKNIAKANKEN